MLRKREPDSWHSNSGPRIGAEEGLLCCMQSSIYDCGHSAGEIHAINQNDEFVIFVPAICPSANKGFSRDGIVPVTGDQRLRLLI